MKQRLALVVFALLAATAAAQNGATLGPAVEPKIRAAMEAGHIPSLAIALVAGDRIVWRGAYGHTNMRAKTKADADSVYLIGSTFKAMSTFALLQQMEKGKFKLDDPVRKYLGKLAIRKEDPKKPVTFRHLLTHTSGLPPAFGPHRVWGDTVPAPIEDYLRKSLRVTGPPETKVVYSNMAYTLVAHLLEKFAGKPYRDCIKSCIFGPLEMKDTAFEPRPDMEERLAIPYVYDAKKKRHHATPRLKADVWPAGIVYGTVADQANWLIANLNGGVFKGRRIISEATHEQVMTRQYDKFAGKFGLKINATSGFGLTWLVAERRGERYFFHSGSVPGYTAFFIGNRDRKTGVAILTNGHRSHPHLMKLSLQAIDLLQDV